MLSDLHGPVRERLDAELAFFDAVTAVSGKLYPVPKDERKAAAVAFLRDVGPPPRADLYIPTNPDCRVLGVIPESGAPMQVRGGWGRVGVGGEHRRDSLPCAAAQPQLNHACPCLAVCRQVPHPGSLPVRAGG